MPYSLNTRCVHGALNCHENNYRPISTPIYQTASFSHIKPGHNEEGFDYTRESNPTRSALEKHISSLENAYDTVAFSSGMAAISACFELFSPGDHLICTDDLYGGVTRLNTRMLIKNGITVDYTDTRDLDAAEKLFRPKTKAIYIETPSNPMMHVTDIRKAAALAHAHKAILIVDNTFLTPYYQNPLVLGADIVIHSGTKYIAGHNDTLCGFLCSSSKELADFFRLTAKTTGAALSPFDSWLAMRGVKTLAVRMRCQQESALVVTEWMKTQKSISNIYYIGLPEHPDYKLNSSQSRGYGSMISFSVDSSETAQKILSGVRLITFAESLGGAESLITYPCVQTHPDVPVKTRERLGITDKLLRLSVGLEDAEDIINDLEEAIGGE